MSPAAERKLIERIAEAAWGVLNHDNDWDGKEAENVYNRSKLIEAITKAMRIEGSITMRHDVQTL